ncbi:MAG: hypothetical protein IT577_10290 [Verrucomicrobiae bacterium]|nr:hypothetical protein [Verrucomicrobiae bacterium]
MARHRHWVGLALAVAAIWGIALIALRGIREQKPTAESLLAFVESRDLDSLHGAERERHLQALADRLNRLPFEERRELREGRALEGVFRKMLPEEQGQFLDRTLPTGFREVMEAFNKMTSEERRKHVERALRDMRARAGEADPGRIEERLADGQARKIIDQGLQSFYRDSTAETKMDLAPLIEEIQAQMQGFRHP